MKTMPIKIESMFNIPENYTGIVEYPNGSKIWYLYGKPHRTDGPAVEFSNGTKGWYLNGKRHRKTGPAIEYPDGRKSYWLNNLCLNENKIDQFVKEFGYPVEAAIKLVYWLYVKQ